MTGMRCTTCVSNCGVKSLIPIRGCHTCSGPIVSASCGNSWKFSNSRYNNNCIKNNSIRVWISLMPSFFEGSPKQILEFNRSRLDIDVKLERRGRYHRSCLTSLDILLSWDRCYFEIVAILRSLLSWDRCYLEIVVLMFELEISTLFLIIPTVNCYRLFQLCQLIPIS